MEGSKGENEELEKVCDKEDKTENKKDNENVFDEEEHASFSQMILDME